MLFRPLNHQRLVIFEINIDATWRYDGQHPEQCFCYRDAEFSGILGFQILSSLQGRRWFDNASMVYLENTENPSITIVHRKVKTFEIGSIFVISSY